jgi:hypothetical protein
MQAETAELQAHLRLFQKVNLWQYNLYETHFLKCGIQHLRVLHS